MRISTLPNGLQIGLAGRVDHLAGLSLWLPVGTAQEPEGARGLVHLIEHLSFRGAQRDSAAHLVQELEQVGCIFHAETSKDLVGYHCRAPHHHFQPILEVLGQLAFAPLAVTPDEVAREGRVLVQEWAGRLSLSETALRLALNTLYPPAYQSSEHHVDAHLLERKELPERVAAFRRAHFHPTGALSVLYHPDLAAALRLAEQVLGVYGGAERLPLPLPEPCAYPRYRRYRTTATATHVAVAFSGPPYGSARREQMAVFNRIFALGFGARLYHRMVAQDGRVYALNTQIDAWPDLGGYALCGSSTEATDDFATYVEEVVCDELEAIARRGLTADEVHRAVERYISFLYLLTENQLKYTRRLARDWLHAGTIFDPSAVAATLRASTVDDYVQLVTDYLRPDRATVAILEPGRGASQPPPEGSPAAPRARPTESV